MSSRNLLTVAFCISIRDKQDYDDLEKFITSRFKEDCSSVADMAAKNKGRSDVAGVSDRLPRTVTCKSHGNSINYFAGHRKSNHKAQFIKIR
jgi:hypothetical protein